MTCECPKMAAKDIALPGGGLVALIALIGLQEGASSLITDIFPPDSVFDPAASLNPLRGRIDREHKHGEFPNLFETNT